MSLERCDEEVGRRSLARPVRLCCQSCGLLVLIVDEILTGHITASGSDINAGGR